MKLQEYEAREIFAKHGIPLPKGFVISSVEEAEKVLEKLKPPLVLKAQVPVASRGKKGGIVFAEDSKTALKKIKELFSKSIDGIPIEKILIVEKVDFQREVYLGFVIDRGEKSIAFLASSRGGESLEEIVNKSPEYLVKYNIDPFIGLRDYMVRNAAYRIGLKEHVREFIKIAKILYQIFVQYDCELSEINPLAVTEKGLVALDTRMIIDDNALYRQEIVKQEIKQPFAYVELDGDIGVIGNGAGLTMATMDLISYYGGKPANFLDIGGGAKAEVVNQALRLLLSKPSVKVIFVNILGGITRCDEVAKGIVEAVKDYPGKRIVVRLKGTREEEGKEILAEVGIEAFDDMEEAAKRAVELALRGG